MRARYRVDVVLGRVKGAYGRDVGGRGWCDARVPMWGLLELWELVQCLGVGGDGFDFLSVVLVLEEVRVQERYFRTLSTPLDFSVTNVVYFSMLSRLFRTTGYNGWNASAARFPSVDSKFGASAPTEFILAHSNFTMEVTRMQESGFKPVGAIAFMVAMVLFYALVWLISYAFVIAWR